MSVQRKSSSLAAALLEVVDNQLRDNQPPETRETLERLCSEGHPRSRARQLIGAALSAEIYETMKRRTEFNSERYVTNLAKLPRLPWGK
jgi:hypothetical protein